MKLCVSAGSSSGLEGREGKKNSHPGPWIGCSIIFMWTPQHALPQVFQSLPKSCDYATAEMMCSWSSLLTRWNWRPCIALSHQVYGLAEVADMWQTCDRDPQTQSANTQMKLYTMKWCHRVMSKGLRSQPEEAPTHQRMNNLNFIKYNNHSGLNSIKYV